MKALPPITLRLFFLLILLPTLLFAKTDIDGFKGMRWGSNLSDLQQTKKLVLTKEGGKSGASLYALENEELRFGKATLTGIQYSFAKERLNNVILLFKGAKNFAAMKAEALAKFGESTKIELTGEEMYNWAGPITNKVLSYNQKSQTGFLFLKPKKMPPPTKVAEKRKPANPIDLETALDKAPPLPQQAMVETFPPEIQGLIDRDQALTQLCWETTGPAADTACVQMRENIEWLKAMGLCVVPGASGPSGTEVVWRRCGPAVAAAPQSTVQVSPQPTPQGTSQMLPEAAPPPAIPQAAPPNDARNQLCLQIGELFAAAAQMRNNGVEPQIAEGELIWYQSEQFPEITIERIRETVELVYFDQSYAQVSGDQLNQQISRSCANRRGPYAHPLP